MRFVIGDLRFVILPLAAVVLLGAAGTGCERVRIGEPLTATAGGPSFEQQMDFWHELNQRPIVSHDEAFHAILLSFDDEAPETYDARVAALVQRGWLDEGFDGEADVAISRGRLSVVLAQALEIEGGLIMRLTGPSPRYATRELVHMNLLPPSTENQTISGSQFVGVMGRVEDHRRSETREDTPTVENPNADADGREV